MTSSISCSFRNLTGGSRARTINPDSKGTLKKAVAAVNGPVAPAGFRHVHGRLDPHHGRPEGTAQAYGEFREIVGALKVRDVRFMPGEHDASLDSGKAFKEFFGDTHYTFDHKGVHFIVIDNVSDPMAAIGDEQLQWLRRTWRSNPGTRASSSSPTVRCSTSTRNGIGRRATARSAIGLLQTHDNVTVFYGHIHQENHFMTGNIAHHSAKGLMFALPVAGSQPKRLPIPWDASAPYKGLGYREVEAERRAGEIRDHRIAGGR